MTDNAMRPEERFLRALFTGELPPSRIAFPFTPDGEGVLPTLCGHIRDALATLSYRERGILEMRYGLGDGYSYTLAQAGQVFQLTRERIRQLQARSLKKLRRRATHLRGFVRDLDV